MKPLKHKDWKLPKIPAKDPKWRKKDHVAYVVSEGKFKKDKKTVIGDKRLYVDLQGYRENDWRERLLAFEANPNSVFNAYWYVREHPMFWTFDMRFKDRFPLVHEAHLIHENGWNYVLISPHMVNPKDNRISNDEHLNTKTEWWYEFGPTLFKNDFGGMGISGHDWKLDGGAKTYDQAIIKVAKSIHKHYGNDRRVVVKKWKDIELPVESTTTK